MAYWSSLEPDLQKGSLLERLLLIEMPDDLLQSSELLPDNVVDLLQQTTVVKNYIQKGLRGKKLTFLVSMAKKINNK